MTRRPSRVLVLVRVLAIAIVILLVLVLGCRPPLPRRTITVTVPDGAGELTVSPPDSLVSKHPREPGSFELAIRGDAPITLSAPGTCPQTIAREVTAADLRAAIEVPSDLPDVGWNAPFSLRVQPTCDEARRGRVDWRVIEGVLASFEIADGGFSLRGRTRAQPAETRPWGIVPVSPRTRGTTVIEARWTDERGHALTRTVRVSAAARASGVASIAVDQTVHLGGRGWRLLRSTPADVRPELVEIEPDLHRFRARRPGQFVLLDEKQRPLSIRAGLHERVPLDCGRSECHRAATDDVQTSPMTHVLRNGLEGALSSTYDPACAIACHAAGEPGLDDGGFVAVAARLGFSLPAPHAGAWDALPRALRRLGGVGCTSCHGPAAIPEPTARFAILRADVCATCHDAPPRYSHVAAWRASAMAQSDRDPIAAGDPACQRCHTTAGFLRTLSSARREDAPREAGPIGIACAACHAPHAAHGASLVREVAVDAPFAALPPKDRICVPCHESGAAAVWAGRSGATSPHASVGCTGCHMTARAGDADRGSAHAFRVDYAACRACHTRGLPSPQEMLRPLVPPSERGSPAHVARMRQTKPSDPQALGMRALAEDRAAWVHNSRYVRAVLGIAPTDDWLRRP